MTKSAPIAPVTICVLLYGDYFALARRVVLSVIQNCPRQDYSLSVGANAVCPDTLKFLELHKDKGTIDRLVVSDSNLNKCPMMRLMFEGIRSEFVWWFDDDSCVTESSALSRWLHRAQASPASTVIWGQLAHCDHPRDFTYLDDPVSFVREAAWYGGLPPPSGDRGEAASSTTKTRERGTAAGFL